MDLKDILKHTQFILRYYGASNQIAKTIEEKCEVITELSRLQAGNADMESLADEVADDLITGLQMAQLVGWQTIRNKVEYKLARQMKRINLGERKDHYDALVADTLEDNVAWGE